MENGDRTKARRCTKCSKVLRETSIWDARVPFEVILNAIPRNTPIMALKYFLRHFECPEGHMGAIMAPVSYSRYVKVRKTNDLTVN